MCVEDIDFAWVHHIHRTVGGIGIPGGGGGGGGTFAKLYDQTRRCVQKGIVQEL